MKKIFKSKKNDENLKIAHPVYEPIDEKTEQTAALAPVYTIANRLRAVFGDDPKVEIPTPEIKSDHVDIHVYDSLKAACIRQLVPCKYEAEGITVNVINKAKDRDISEVVAVAFDGNPHFSGIIVSKPPDDAPIIGGEVFSTVFKKEVIQFPNGNAGAIGGRETTVMEELARDLLKNVGKMTFCTELK